MSAVNPDGQNYLGTVVSLKTKDLILVMLSVYSVRR